MLNHTDINELLDDMTVLKSLCSLRDRWADESEYEDWQEYSLAIQNLLPEKFRAQFVKATKRPFGFVLNYKTGTVNISLKIRRTTACLACRVNK